MAGLQFTIPYGPCVIHILSIFFKSKILKYVKYILRVKKFYWLRNTGLENM